jgi:hypothetical protein
LQRWQHVLSDLLQRLNVDAGDSHDKVPQASGRQLPAKCNVVFGVPATMLDSRFVRAQSGSAATLRRTPSGVGATMTGQPQ